MTKTKIRPLSERPHARHFEGPTMTKQSFKDACDINQIMLRYQKTGIVDHVNKYEGQYADLDGATYTDYMNKVANALSMFEELPSKARTYFNHDPAQFLNYVNDLDDNEDTRQHLVELGLSNHRIAIPSDEPTPTPPPVKQDADEA